MLDVSVAEPPPASSRLWDHPRVVLTPHSSAYGSGNLAREAESFAANLRRFLDGAALRGEVTDIEVAG